MLPISVALPAFSSNSVKVWHFTDVHVDPYYIVGSDAKGCYCETTASCSVTGSSCYMQPNATLAAPEFGNSEGNCATPHSLYESALNFMAKEAGDAAMVYFTGDFAEAGASSPCAGGPGAQRQLLDIMHYDIHTLQARLPHSKIVGSFGNHDSARATFTTETRARRGCITT